MEHDKDRMGTLNITGPSFSDLRGKQSVRVTFKLSEKAIDALSIVAVQLGIKQKSLFDHLMDDNSSLRSVARSFNQERFSELQRVQKTYVLSRNTLHLLENACRQFNAPRDAVVEYSIQRLESIIESEKEKHTIRKEILNDYRNYLEKGKKLLEKYESLLDNDDPVFRQLEIAFSANVKAYREIEGYVEKGKVLEEF